MGAMSLAATCWSPVCGVVEQRAPAVRSGGRTSISAATAAVVVAAAAADGGGEGVVVVDGSKRQRQR